MEKNKSINVKREILLFAFRYALGRESYAPYSVTEAIKANIDSISITDIKQYIKEIEEHKDLGMSFDEKHWLNFKECLKEELDKRLI